MTLSGSRTEVLAKLRLEYFRGEIEAGRMSYGDTLELESLRQYIEPGDVVLLEWAGVPESEAYQCQECHVEGGHARRCSKRRG